MMTKAQLDEQLRDLQIGVAEMAAEMGGIGDAEAFDIANGFITNEIATAIKKYYNVNDIQGFVANHIA